MGRVMVNGRPVHKPRIMRHHDRLILGRSHCFRFLVPKMKAKMQLREGEENDRDEMLTLESALGEVVQDDCAEYEQCRVYVRELEARVGSTRAQVFLREFARTLPLVDEANEITQEVRASDRLRFSVEVVSDLFTYETDAPELVVRVWKRDTGIRRFRNVVRRMIDKKREQCNILKLFSQATGRRYSAFGLHGGSMEEGSTQEEPERLVCVWEIEEFTDRLEEMREMYEVFRNDGRDEYEELMSELGADPWMNHSYHAVQQILQNVTFQVQDKFRKSVAAQRRKTCMSSTVFSKRISYAKNDTSDSDSSDDNPKVQLMQVQLEEARREMGASGERESELRRCLAQKDIVVADLKQQLELVNSSAIGSSERKSVPEEAHGQFQLSRERESEFRRDLVEKDEVVVKLQRQIELLLSERASEVPRSSPRLQQHGEDSSKRESEFRRELAEKDSLVAELRRALELVSNNGREVEARLRQDLMQKAEEVGELKCQLQQFRSHASSTDNGSGIDVQVALRRELAEKEDLVTELKRQMALLVDSDNREFQESTLGALRRDLTQKEDEMVELKRQLKEVMTSSEDERVELKRQLKEVRTSSDTECLSALRHDLLQKDHEVVELNRQLVAIAEKHAAAIDACREKDFLIQQLEFQLEMMRPGLIAETAAGGGAAQMTNLHHAGAAAALHKEGTENPFFLRNLYVS